MRSRPILFGCLALALLATPIAVPLRRHLVWNASASLPTGLYLLRARRSLRVGDRVAIMPPPALATLMDERRYLPAGVPLLKRVAAVSGQRICRVGLRITIDGISVATARSRDSRGRPLPVWQGCHHLHARQIFALNPAVPDSFDGRYFGPTALDDVLGRALPVWTDEAGNGRHELFAIDPTFPVPTPTNRSKL